MAQQTGQTGGLAGRYATALYGLADEVRMLDAVAGDLKGLRTALVASSDLRRLIASPLIARGQQERAMVRVLTEAGAAPLTVRFAAVVARHRRLFALPAIIEAYLAELARRRGEVRAQVTSAVALDDARTQAVTAALRGVFGAKIEIDARVDPAILGGLVVRVGSRMIDSSLAGKLQRLELALKGVA